MKEWLSLKEFWLKDQAYEMAVPRSTDVYGTDREN
jgi:hypothetical protein